MRPPCDDAIILSGSANSPCRPEARPWILAATILGSSIAFIDSTVVNVALPALQSSLHATVVDVQWIIESYGVLLAALILVGGALGDIFGRRLVFLIGLVIFAIGSAACGFSTTVAQLVAARSLQGIGAAALVPGSLSIISAYFDEQSRGRAIGTWSGFTAISTAGGPVIGGWLIEHVSWRWVFFINLPLAAAVILISLAFIPESKSNSAQRVDWRGASLVTIGLGALVYGFINTSNLGWHDPRVSGALILGVLSLVAFVLVELREDTPMVPPSLFNIPAFTGANLLTLFLYSAIGVFFFLLPLDLIQVHGYSATAAGASTLPLTLLMFSLSRWSGGLVARYGPRLPLIIGPLIVAAGFIIFALVATQSSYWRSYFPAFLVFGVGLSVTVAPLTTTIMTSVDNDRAGTASGINNAVARVAGVLAIAIIGIVMVAAFRSHLHDALANLKLPPAALDSIHSNETKLAGLEVPPGLDARASASVHAAITQAFIYSFRLVLLVCAALALISALISWRMIPANCPAVNSAPRTSPEGAVQT
jgi:EmrB/QacA subfamily drug resistance transporter